MDHFDGSAQDFGNSIANALKLLQFCTKPSIWPCVGMHNFVVIKVISKPCFTGNVNVIQYIKCVFIYQILVWYNKIEDLTIENN